MHIEILDDDEFVVFVNNERINNVNFDVYNDIENYFKKLFWKLKKYYKLEIYGYYYIKIYKDKFYGIILEIKREDIDYIDMFDNQVEMNIEVITDNFVYNVDDYFFLDKNDNIDIYVYNKKFYINIKKKIAKKINLKILEFSRIIYGNDAAEILKNGKKI